MAVYKKLLLSAGGGIVSTLQQAEQNPSLATLYIGLGGTGVDCIRNIKTQVYNRLRPDPSNNPIKEYKHIRFVGVDTDKTSLSAGKKASDDKGDEDESILGLDETEIFTIANPQAATAMKSESKIQLSPEMYWLNPDIDAASLTDTGAGGIRQAGRFMLVDKSSAYINRIKDELTKAMAGLTDPTIIINICSGLGGGTGSGCFLDACYLARQAASEMGIGEKAKIFGFFFLPEVNLSNIPNTHKAYNYVQTNGYAAMQELDYCMNLPKNGGSFTQVYKDNISVEWNRPPVDMCYLIGATRGGNIIENAYDYAMNVVSEYSMDILTREIDSKKFGILSQLSNFRQIVAETNNGKAIGAELSYLILGAACASVPFKEINTYLASAVFSRFAATGKRVPNESEVAKFASDTLIKAAYRGSSGGNIWRALFSEVKEGIHFESYDDEDWKDVWESATVSDGRPRANAEFVNFYTQNSAENKGIITKNAESMLSGTNTESLVNRIRRELNKFVCDMAYGPSFANGILDAARTNNLDNILSGLIAQNELNKRQEAAQNRYKECCDTITKPNGWKTKKGKYEDFKAAFELLIQHEVELAAYDALDTILKGLQKELRAQAAGYYGKLNTISETLVETFASNMRTLEGGKGHKNSYMKTLVSVSEIQSTLDDRVKELDMSNSYKLLMEEFLKNEAAWITTEEIKIASLINDFFVNNVFANFASRTLETFLYEKYKTTTNADLANYLYNDWMQTLTAEATPLFNFNPIVWDNSRSTPMAYLSVSNTCEALNSAAEKMHTTDNKWAVKQTAHDDRIFVMCCTCALPLGSNNNVTLYEQHYYAASSEGRHYYESKQYGKKFGEEIQADWSNLPSVIPMSLARKPMPLLASQIDQSKALYKRAVEAGVLKSTSKEEDGEKDGQAIKVRVMTNEIYAPNEEGVRKLEDLIGKANAYQLNIMADVAGGEALVAALRSDDALSLESKYSLRHDGSQVKESITESIRMDYFGFAPVYQQKVREIMAQVSELREKAEAAAVDLGNRIEDVIIRYTSIPQFCDALFYGVIKVEGNTIKYEKPGGLLGPKVYVLASSEAANAEYESVRLYQAYVNYNALEDAVRDDIKKALNTLKDQGETAMIEPLRTLSEGMLSAKKIAIALGAADAFRNAADIKTFYKEIVAKFEAIA